MKPNQSNKHIEELRKLLKENNTLEEYVKLTRCNIARHMPNANPFYPLDDVDPTYYISGTFSWAESEKHNPIEHYSNLHEKWLKMISNQNL